MAKARILKIIPLVVVHVKALEHVLFVEDADIKMDKTVDLVFVDTVLVVQSFENIVVAVKVLEDVFIVPALDMLVVLDKL